MGKVHYIKGQDLKLEKYKSNYGSSIWVEDDIFQRCQSFHNDFSSLSGDTDSRKHLEFLVLNANTLITCFRFESFGFTTSLPTTTK